MQPFDLCSVTEEQLAGVLVALAMVAMLAPLGRIMWHDFVASVEHRVLRQEFRRAGYEETWLGGSVYSYKRPNHSNMREETNGSEGS